MHNANLHLLSGKTQPICQFFSKNFEPECVLENALGLVTFAWERERAFKRVFISSKGNSLHTSAEGSEHKWDTLKTNTFVTTYPDQKYFECFTTLFLDPV